MEKQAVTEGNKKERNVPLKKERKLVVMPAEKDPTCVLCEFNEPHINH